MSINRQNGSLTITSAVRLEQQNAELTARNEELVRLEQELLLQSTALETAANGVIITDTSGIILWVNSAFTTLTGYTAEEVIGKTPRLLKSGQHDREYYKGLWKTILAGNTWRGDFTNRRKDGSLYHDEHTITPVRSKAGIITHFIAIMNDVTERKRAEQAMAESEARFRLLAENITDVFWIASPDLQKMFYVSASYERLWCRSVEELYAHPEQWSNAILPEERKNVLEVFATLKGNVSSVSIEYRIARPDGTIRWVHDRGFQVRDAVGQLVRLTGIVADVTERKQNEESLTLFRSLVDRSPDAIEVIDPETGRYLDINETGRQRLGYSREEILSLNLADVVDFPGGPFSVKAAINEVRETGFKVVESRHRRKDGSTFPVEINVQYIEVDRAYVIAVVRDITERKLAEEALRSSESNMLAAQRLAHIGSWEIGLSNPTSVVDKPAHCSDEMFRIAGYEPGAVKTSNELFLKLVPTNEHEKLHAAMSNAIAKRQGYSIVHRLIRPNGEERVVQETAMVIVDEKTGQPVKLVGTTQDITERVEAEDQLRWKTALFEAQVHSALDGILVIGSDGKKVLQNQRAIDLWNIPKEISDELDDRRQLEWVSKQTKNPEQFAERVAHLSNNPDEVSCDELELVDERFIERYSAPVRGKNGEYYGRIWSFHDVTKRKLSELQNAEQAALLDQTQDAILVGDLEGKILFWNKGAERMYGWTKEEVLGKKVSDLIYTAPALFKSIMVEIVEKGVLTSELEHVAKDDRKLVVEARRTLIRDNQGNPKSVLVIYTDITEKRKIEAQFMRAQRMESIGTLAGGIAHDLNNILTPIMMAIEILKSDSDSPQTTKILETIEVSARRGADIVRQVLSFARGLEGQRIEVQSKHLLKDLENIIKNTFPKDIRLQFSVPNETWTILGDPTQVHQILLNLSVNARDAMPNGGTLTIGVQNRVLDEQYAAMNIQTKPGRYVVIDVTDTGTGIPQSIIDKIFDPFFTTKDINKGTGLGLSTVMAIVKSHDGIINVYSELGKGTTFKVYLPAMEIASVTQQELSERADLPRGHGETVLVVDDEASILVITSQTLQAFGYQVLTATDGADAVAVYARHMDEIAVVLTDMAMPIMDGQAEIHALMRINPLVKIIAASGLHANGGVAKESGPGVKHFLTKPYTAATLLKIMRKILDEA